MPVLPLARRPICLVLLATQLLTACTSWQVETVPLTNRLRLDPPSSVRLWLADSTRMDIRDPRWVNDSVAGTLTAVSPRDTTGTRVPKKPIAVPAGDVTSYATLHSSPGKTIGLIVGVFVVVAAVAGAIYAASDPCYLACD